MTAHRIYGIDANLILALDALLSERSVTRAAKRVGVGQSAMSHSLRRLRGHFGDPLLMPRGREMVLTRRAHALLEPSRRLVESMEQLLVPQEAFVPAKARATVVLGCSDLVAYLLLPPLLERLAREAPGVDVEMRPLGLRPVLHTLEDGVDLLFGAYSKVAPGIRREPLFDEEYACLVRRDHPQVRTKLTLEQFTRLPHLVASPTERPWRRVDDALAKHGVSRRVSVHVSHYLLAPLVARRTDHIVTMSARVARELSKMLPVRIFEPPVPLPPYTISQLWLEAREADPVHRWLRGLTREMGSSIG